MAITISTEMIIACVDIDGSRFKNIRINQYQNAGNSTDISYIIFCPQHIYLLLM